MDNGSTAGQPPSQIYRYLVKTGQLVVPMHGARDLATGTLNRIFLAAFRSGTRSKRPKRHIREAITLYLEELREHGEIVPEPTTKVEYVDAR